MDETIAILTSGVAVSQTLTQVKGKDKRQAPSPPSKKVSSNGMVSMSSLYLKAEVAVAARGPPTGAGLRLTQLDFDDIMEEDNCYADEKECALLGRQSSHETKSSLSTAIEHFEDFEKDDEDDISVEDDDDSFVKKRSATKR